MAITSTQTQGKSSYVIEFNATSSTWPLNTNPNSYLKIQIYDSNGNLYHTVNNWTQGINYPYTFNSKNVGNYTVIYTVYSGNPLDNPDVSSSTAFQVFEYQPTFTLPTVTCAELGIPFSFYPTSWNQNENGLCPTSPLSPKNIIYKRYEFNLGTSIYDLKDEKTYVVSEIGSVTDPKVYAYMGGAWVPDKLAMVKFVVKINNCSSAVEKATVFPICGSWKIRRLACGNYRIYNYKNTNIVYQLYKGVSPTNLLKSDTAPAFAYVGFDLPEDGIYRITADGVTQYIFNYCSIENCVLELQKKVLLDDNLCSECKMDKALYQKALRLIPVYETWKKLLDKDWVYDVQYQSTDVNNYLSALYDAEELYLELKNLCADCENVLSKKCGCK
jgi:hypothetical protein